MISRRASGYLLLVGCVLYVVLSIVNKNAARYVGSSSFSNRNSGASVFAAFAEKVKGSDFLRRRTPILQPADLDGIGTYVILAPKAEVSEREAALLEDFVRRGGHLFASFDSEQSIRNVKNLLAALGTDSHLKTDASFHNQRTVTHRIAPTDGLMSRETTLEFYGRYLLEDSPERASAFLVDRPLGSGTYTLVAGLAPITNALIGRAENRQLALMLVQGAGTLVIDEYHHFFSEKTIWNLLMEPHFALPIFGITAFAIVFFLFGRLSPRDAWSSPSAAPDSRSLHDFGKGLLYGLTTRGKTSPESIYEHALFLERLFPNQREMIRREIDSHSNNWLETGSRLVELHKRLLAERGWRL